MYVIQVSMRVSGFPVYILKSLEGKENPERYDHNIISKKYH